MRRGSAPPRPSSTCRSSSGRRAGARRARIAYLAATATYCAYINNRARFASPATELYHGRLTVLDAIDGLLLDHPELGLSTYDRHSDGSGVCYASRLRPATNVKPGGRHWNFNLDLFIVDWLEQQGVDYDVVTEEDLHHEGLDLLRPYAVVLTGSHPEYDSRGDAGRASMPTCARAAG